MKNISRHNECWDYLQKSQSRSLMYINFIWYPPANTEVYNLKVIKQLNVPKYFTQYITHTHLDWFHSHQIEDSCGLKEIELLLLFERKAPQTQIYLFQTQTSNKSLQTVVSNESYTCLHINPESLCLLISQFKAVKMFTNSRGNTLSSQCLILMKAGVLFNVFVLLTLIKVNVQVGKWKQMDIIAGFWGGSTVVS